MASRGEELAGGSTSTMESRETNAATTRDRASTVGENGKRTTPPTTTTATGAAAVAAASSPTSDAVAATRSLSLDSRTEKPKKRFYEKRPKLKKKLARWVQRFFFRPTAAAATTRATEPTAKALPASSARGSKTASSPAAESDWTPDTADQPVAGVAGLRNHGNTCFMNAVLQCLCSTDSFAEYLVMDRYRDDLERRSAGATRRPSIGARGEVTEQLATLMKSVWSCTYDSRITLELKQLIGKCASQYRGSAQHDAQEFLLWLLDKVHEDVNRATKKKYKCLKDAPNRPDREVAAEALANHMRCNNSFISNVFQAQYRSALTCPVCGRQSVTFDPFLCVSLPLPQSRRRYIELTAVYRDHDRPNVKLAVAVDFTDTIEQLRLVVARVAAIPVQYTVLTEVSDAGFDRTFADGQSVSAIRDGNSGGGGGNATALFAFEARYQKPRHLTNRSLASLISTSSQGSRRSSSSTRETLLILVAHQLMLPPDQAARRFGPLSVLRVYRDLSFLELQNVIFKHSVKHGREAGSSLTGEMKHSVLLKLRVINGSSRRDAYLPSNVDHPLFTSLVDRAKAFCPSDAGPPHIKLVVEWDDDVKRRLLDDRPWPKPIEHESLRQATAMGNQPDEVTLEECFKLYTSEEQLGSDDAWFCPSCKKRQEGTLKRLGLWTLPEVLIVHLKRFRQVSPIRRTKLHTLVKFPVTDLDVTPYLENPDVVPGRSHADENVYDLYAVCNHSGGMASGHYTAHCLNPVNSKWYAYDDHYVEAVNETAVRSRGAYILFYVKRNPGSAASAQQFQHWVHQMPKFKPDFAPEPEEQETAQQSEGLESAV